MAAVPRSGGVARLALVRRTTTEREWFDIVMRWTEEKGWGSMNGDLMSDSEAEASSFDGIV